MAIMALTSCVREELLSSSRNGEEGESVKVELSFKIPPASSPQELQSRSMSTDNAFSVEFFKEASLTKTRSGEVAELYNLWLFQFHSDGSIHGSPQQVSDQVTMVNEMALLNVTLRVGTDQTLYIVALGKKVTVASNLMEVRTIKELENLQLDYVDNRNGLYYSRITNESEIPYAGAAKGISVNKTGNSDNGEIVYGTPDGFSGGIEVKRLVSRITLKHKFDVTENTLEGMRLLKVPTKLCINPASADKDVIDNIPMADLESDNAFGDADKDTDGFFTSQWYVAQNKQGTISDIVSERDRYRKVTDGSGKAPEAGTNIEAWSYSKSDRKLYTVHQIYVGNNNTNNFDVEINSYYDLRTIINSVDLNDGRIRSYTAVQKVYLSSSSYPTSSGSGTGTITGKTNVYFDAHYGWRPVIIYAQGRKVTVGIYKDAQCTQLANMNSATENWLQLSAYPNYTEVVRNGGANVLTNQIETNIFVPTRFKLYLYADEYITDENGVITDPEFDRNKVYNAATNYLPTNFVSERTLYVKVTTEDITAEGTSQKREGKYTIKQKQGHYVGLFGGEIENGQYTEGLIIDAFNENNFQIDDEIATAFYMYSGYYNVMTNYVWKEGEDPETNYRSFMNGKQATFNLATNPKNYVVNNGQESIIPPMRKINGNIDLYQYNYYNSFQARFCHDLNRDKNGNGVIDYLPDDPEKNEFEWYLPSTYQAFGILTSAGTIIYDAPNALALERNATLATGWMMEGGGWYSSNTGKNSWKWVRCVRDIPVPPERKTGTKVTTYIDNGDTYALIDLSTLPYGITDRTTAEGKTELYEELDLYSYSTKGTEYDPENPQKDASQPLGKKVFRGRKNYPPSKTTTTVTLQTLVSSFSSPRFIVSPTDVYNDGDTKSNSASSILQDTEGTPQSNSITMTWAEANGRLNTANSQGWNIPSKAMNTGCYAYKGKSGKDEPGSWRVPNSRELSMILVFAHELERFSSETGFQKLYEAKAANYLSNGYWSSTEQSSTLYSLDKATSGLIDVNYGLTIYEGANKTSTDKNRLRCIKDIPLN
jgi:putative lipoprotein